MTAPVRSFALFACAWIPVCIGLFLLISGFLSTWNGQMASVRPATEEKPFMYQVLVVDDDGSTFEDHWPAWALEGTDLAIDRFALPPTPLPEGLPRTKKQRFALSFLITPADGTVREISTATPQTLGLSLFAFFGGLLLRNMVVAGNPFSVEPKGIELVKGQAAAGSIVRPNQGAASGESNRATRRSKKGPPPRKKRRGGGRRK